MTSKCILISTKLKLQCNIFCFAFRSSCLLYLEHSTACVSIWDLTVCYKHIQCVCVFETESDRSSIKDLCCNILCFLFFSFSMVGLSVKLCLRPCYSAPWENEHWNTVGHWAHPFHLIHLAHRDDTEEFWEVFFSSFHSFSEAYIH